MKLATKLISTVLVGVLALVSIEGYVSMQRSVRLFDQEMADHALLLGRTVRPLVAAAWLDGGEPRAREVIADASREDQSLRIRLFPAHLMEEQLASFDETTRSAIQRGAEVSTKREGPTDSGARYTFVPITVDDELLAVIQLTEPLAALDAYRWRSAIETGGLVVLVALLGALAMRFLGLHMVGRPLHLLTEKARRVGRGDLEGTVSLKGQQELQELAEALNTMCDDLTLARAEALAETEAKLRAIEQARHRDRLHTIGGLAAGVAHELGTPLTVISGRADMISELSQPSEEVADFARVIKEQALRMDGIIRELLQFGRRAPPGKQVVQASTVVRTTVRVMHPLAQQYGVELRLHEEYTPSMEVDPQQIQQVLTNLILNALQASTPGGRVDIRTAPARAESRVRGEAEDYVRITVRDGGAGMTNDTLRRLFDPFFTTKGVGEGTGLGLSIAQGIVVDHGGWIDVQSEAGEGSTFDVYLPVEVDD